MIKLDEDVLRDLTIAAALCDHIVETGELPKDWGDDDMPPEGEFDLDNLHYVGMLLLTLWRQARTEIDGKSPF